MRRRHRNRPWDYDPEAVKTTKIAEADRDDVLKEVRELLEFRDHTLRLKEPIWEPQRLYDSLVPDEVRGLLETLLRIPSWRSCVNHDRNISVFFMEIPREAANQNRLHDNLRQYASAWQYRLVLDHPVPCPRFGYTDSLLMFPDHPQYRVFMDYINDMDALVEQNKQCADDVQDVLETCNTWGQVQRLWPSLFTFLPSNFGKVKSVQEQKQASRLPKRLLDNPEELDAVLLKRTRAEQIMTQAVLLKAQGKPPERLDLY